MQLLNVGTAVCPEYRGVCTSEAFSIFPVPVAMYTRAVQHYEPTFPELKREQASTEVTIAQLAARATPPYRSRKVI